MYFSEIYSIFFLDSFFHFFISLQNVGDLYAPPCISETETDTKAF